MTPMILKPAVKDYLWGGTRLKTEYAIESDLAILAESWMLSCHKDGPSTVINGENAGKTLPEVLAQHPEYAGTKAAGGNFPVLIKLIDAKNDLSIQVHPDDEYAMRVEGESGKTEAWYIVDCDPGACLIYGFKDELTKEEFRTAIETNTLLDKVNRVEVKKGDLFFIKAGTLHAIGKGILLAEIQQSSNTTYRVYDYGRLQNGKPRELHIDKAVDVTVCKPMPADGKPQGVTEQFEAYTKTVLVDCNLFQTQSLQIHATYADTADSASFVSLLVLDGQGELQCGGTVLPLQKGESVFLPAGSGCYTLNGTLHIIRTNI